MSSLVKVYIYWKDGLVFNSNAPNFDKQRKKNEIVYKIVSSKFGIFPKSLIEFNTIKSDLVCELLHFNDIIIVFQYIDTNKLEILCKLPDPNFELYASVISNIFLENSCVKVVTDKVAERVERSYQN